MNNSISRSIENQSMGISPTSNFVPDLSSYYYQTQETKDISNSSKSITSSKKLSPGYGLLPNAREYTPKTRRKIQEGAIFLESLDPENILLITITIPGSTQEAIIGFESYSSYFIGRFTQWVRDQLKEKKVKSAKLGLSQKQPKQGRKMRRLS